MCKGVHTGTWITTVLEVLFLVTLDHQMHRGQWADDSASRPVYTKIATVGASVLRSAHTRPKVLNLPIFGVTEGRIFICDDTEWGDRLINEILVNYLCCGERSEANLSKAL